MTDSTDNARGPERIWADTDGVWREYDPSDFKTVVGEYIRADLAPDPLRAVKVRALVWKNGHAHGVGHHYFTRNGCLYRRETSGETGLHCGPAWEIEKVAQADYEARIRFALEPDPLDARVVKLLEALRKIAEEPCMDPDGNAAIARAALAALSPTGGSDDKS